MRRQRNTRSHYGLTLHVVEESAQATHNRQVSEVVAKIGTEILFDPRVLDTYHYNGWKQVHYDLLVVCAAVEFADRQCYRRSTQWSRTMNINIPVLDLAAWKQKDVQSRLRDALRQLTGDNWQFCFFQANKSSDSSARQRPLPFRNDKEFVVAYSDGVDSRCVSGLFDQSDSIVRVRVTKNKNRPTRGERPFDLIPFSVRSDARESVVRFRGFKFAAITAIAAQLSGVSEIIVPESGQGALGPVLLPLHNLYPDYRNHPTFLRKMERFIEPLLRFRATYEQPRLWYTKGQTIKDFLAHSTTGEECVVTTRSCWQQRWNARLGGKLRQCGLCAACLLRRMSMHAAKVKEPAATYSIGDLTVAHYRDALPRANGMRLSNTMVEHGSVGVRHLQQLADMDELPDAALAPHVFQIARATGASEQDTFSALKNLLLQHAEEWRDFVAAQGQRSFIRDWTSGGRYGRSE